MEETIFYDKDLREKYILRWADCDIRGEDIPHKFYHQHEWRVPQEVPIKTMSFENELVKIRDMIKERRIIELIKELKFKKEERGVKNARGR